MTIRRMILVVLGVILSSVSACTTRAAPAPADTRVVVAAKAWKELCNKPSAWTADVRAVLLADKDLTKKPLKLHKGLRYRTVKDSSKGYAQPIANQLFFSVFNKDKAKTLGAVGRFVEKIGAHAEAFRRKSGPLLVEGEKIERAAKALCELPADCDASLMKSFKTRVRTGKGRDELSYCLRKLSAALAAGRVEQARVWAGETHGAVVRLVDLLRWVDLQTEWIVDLAAVFGSFKPYFDNSDAVLSKVGGWRIFMFGRCPAGQSIQTICSKDVLMVEHLLVDFYTVSRADTVAMGKGGDAALLTVTPARRSACRKILAALPARARPVFRKILRTDFELSAFGSNICRYEDEGRLDDLIRSLKRHVANYPDTTVGSMMEIIHIPKGAWCATTTATDRYHPKLIEWAGKVQGKPRKAFLTAHGFAHKLYSRGGYQGSVKTLTDAIKSGRMDCIRISQLIGTVYANAGYIGLHPIRVGKGSVREKKVATSGHTLLSVKFADGEVGVEGLGSPGFGTPYAQRYKAAPNVLSCSRGYRALCGWVAGEMYFPQGIIKSVQLRIPYYGIKRKGFSKQTGKPILLPAPSTQPRCRTVRRRSPQAGGG